MRNSRHAEERGAALIVAIAVMTILLAISLTFFTVSRLELKTATNVENTVKAELLANAATNIAISFLNHDLLIHPTFTSLDHAWRTYFNGAWVAGKGWAFPPSGVPWMRDPSGYVDILYGDRDLWPFDTGDKGLIGHMYVPRWEDVPVEDGDPANYSDEPGAEPFVIDPFIEMVEIRPGIFEPRPSNRLYDKPLFTAAQVDTWADVDNDQDGYRDSMWIPLVADTFHGNVKLVSGDPSIPTELIELGDRIDNDLDLELYDYVPWYVDEDKDEDGLPWYDDPDEDMPLGQILGEDEVDEINETAPFLYYGGSDGFDNDGDGEIDEDGERWAAAMGLDIPRFFLTAPLTAPLNAADRTYLVLRNVPILDPAGEVFRYVNIDTDPRLDWPYRWVDVLDNDYDLITNKHTEYYTDLNDPDLSEPDNHILPVDEFNDLRGVYEISPRYLEHSIRQNWRIKSTGEPVCELVGRAAILVTDEASKVNINVAGGHSLDVPGLLRLEEDQGYSIDLADVAHGSSGELTGWWRAAFGHGLGPNEYYTSILPRVDPPRARKLWHYLMGAPNGSQALGSLEDPTDPPQIEPEFVADSVLPGYGFVDDNGNALLLAMNGIDDDGDGLIDEGLNDGSDLTQAAVQTALDYGSDYGITFPWRPEWTDEDRAEYVYWTHLGQLLEGVDEPGEFRQRRPHRNAVAEGKQRMSDGITFDENDNDLDGVSNEIGEMADRVFRTRQELKRTVRNEGSAEGRTNANAFFERLRNFVTLHSVDAGNRYQEALRVRSPLAPAFDLYPTLKSPVNLKLNYAYARGDEVAQALEEGWDLRSPTPEYSGPGDGPGELDFAAALQQEGVTLALDPPAPYEVPSFIDPESGFTVDLGWQGFRSPVHFLERCPPEQTCAWRPAQDNDGRPVPYYADPGLRALRLGATLRDFVDTDYARTELTMAVDRDPWWWKMDRDRLVREQGLTRAEAEAEAEIRPIQYTVSGFEGVRITEMMVRPVRRVEAEMSLKSLMNVGQHFYFNPNVIEVFPGELGFTAADPADPADQVFQASMQDKINEIIGNGGPYAIGTPLPPGNQYWKYPYPGNPQNESEGFLGSTAAMVTDYITEYNTVAMNGIPVYFQADPPPDILGSWPNIMEFVFGPGPGLPPGRYYLMINTTDWEGNPTVTEPEHLLFATKYVRGSALEDFLKIRPNGDPAMVPYAPPMSVAPNDQTIRDDVAGFCMGNYVAGVPSQPAQAFYDNYDNLHWQDLSGDDPRSCIGREDMDPSAVDSPRTGWVFLATSGDELWYEYEDPPAVPPQPPDDWGYDQDQAFTVTIPHYAQNPADQVYLHVAVCMGEDGPYNPNPGDPLYVPELAINFFDFSQEPDHEWVEIENVSGHDVDVSGWELFVGGVDPAGEVVTEDTVEMRIPEQVEVWVQEHDQWEWQDVVLGTKPPYNRLLLAVNARDYFEYDELGPINENLMFMNGIGLVGADLSTFPGAFNFQDVTSPAIPMRAPGRDPSEPNDDGRGLRICAYEADREVAYVFEGVDCEGEIVQEGLDYQGRIVQLEGLYSPHQQRSLLSTEDPVDRNVPDDIAYWVLRGGVFPNYPEHDGIDNDADNDVLSADGVDNNGNSLVLLYDGVDNDINYSDEDWHWGIPYPGLNQVLDDPYEGVDEPLLDEVTRLPILDAAGYLIRVEGIDEGRFRMDYGIPVPLIQPPWFVLQRSPSPGSFSGGAVQYSSMLFNYNDSLDCSTFGFADYLSDPAAPPEWKEFVERRFFPGDNVVVSLFQTVELNSGGRLRTGVVDRVTYTERDVINRAIDDFMDVGAPFASFGVVQRARPTLYGGMVGPYELYGCMDGPYEIYMTFWPDNTMGIDFYRTLERKYHPLYNGDRFGTQNRWQATDGNYDDWSHEPVMARNNAGQHVEFTVDGGFQLRPEKWFGSPLKVNAAAWDLDNVDVASPDTDPYLLNLKLGQEGIDHLNRRPASVGDVLSMPYFSMTKTYVYFEGTGEFGPPVIDGTRMYEKLGVPEVHGLLLGQSHPDDVKALVGAGSMSAVTLSCAQAEFRVIGLNPADLDTSDLGWQVNQGQGGSTVYVAPRQWAPLFLYRLGDDDDQAFEYWVGLEKRPDHDPPQVGDTLDNFLFNAPPLPAGVLQGHLVSRWPIGERAVLYASPNLEGFGQDTGISREHFPPVAAEALFIWDGADGLEDGEYNLYIDTGGRLDRLLKADDAYYEHATQELLTDLGRWVANEAANTMPDDLLLDVEVFTDRDGDGRCWPDYVEDGDDILAWSELSRGGEGDSFGAHHGLTPDWDGYIHYGIVRIENNYLAVFLRNWAPEGQLNRFAGVVLTPRDREPGRINVNTVVTQSYEHSSTSIRAFNALMGVPGILLNADRDPGAVDGAPPEVTLAGDEPMLPIIPLQNVETDSLGRAQLVEASRPSYWDGRYYTFLSDLIADEPNAVGSYPLSTEPDPLPRMEEVTWRFSQAANLLTTRSDVFEILVTVQSGYGIDVEGDPAGGADGRIDYRSSTEFIVTAEKKTRTIYER